MMRAFREPEMEIIVIWMVSRNLPIGIVYGYALYIRRRQRNFKNPVAVAVVYRRIANRRPSPVALALSEPALIRRFPPLLGG